MEKFICPGLNYYYIVMKIVGYKAEEQTRGAIETSENVEVREEIDRKEKKSFYFIAFGLIFYALYPTISIPPANTTLGIALFLFLLGSGCIAFAIIYVFWLARKMCSSTF